MQSLFELKQHLVEELSLRKELVLSIVFDKGLFLPATVRGTIDPRVEPS